MKTKRKMVKVSGLFILAYLMCSVSVSAQAKKGVSLGAGADFYSSYIWRGTQYGSGPSVQPSVTFSAGSFSAGAWGAFDFNGYRESDLWFAFDLPAGFRLGMTDYYYPGLDYFDFSGSTGTHAFEINTGFSKGGLNLSANYILNKAGNAGSAGSDIYAEARYSFDILYLFLGAGSGWHTSLPANEKNKFRICNLGLGTSKEIHISDTFSIPVNAQVIVNPDRKIMFLLLGFTIQP
ncbi:MAG: hypothetical protein GYA43_10790 [Bacteroidales bacterium]|nr:hypothetical protein [Bacteroidales bacterium]